MQYSYLKAEYSKIETDYKKVMKIVLKQLLFYISNALILQLNIEYRETLEELNQKWKKFEDLYKRECKNREFYEE